MVSRADLTIMNETERIQFQEMTGSGSVELALKKEKGAIVTLGAQGAELFSLQGSEKIPTQVVETVIDATGCGDAFRSGLVYGLSEGWSLQRSVQLGNIIGSIKIQSL